MTMKEGEMNTGGPKVQEVLRSDEGMQQAEEGAGSST